MMLSKLANILFDIFTGLIKIQYFCSCVEYNAMNNKMPRVGPKVRLPRGIG